MANLIRRFTRFFKKLFLRRKHLKIGIYGPPNGGKTTLANRICSDWLGEELGKASKIPHETRKVQMKEEVRIKSGKHQLTFALLDTPGIATRIDYEDFVSAGLSEKEAKQRARDAARGVIEAIKWLDEMDIVVLVLDATKDPYNQVNLTILGNLEARNIPVLIVANKIDLKRANVAKITSAFPNHKIIGISAKFGNNMEDFYRNLIELSFI
ncbi:MAG: Era-like GTP-binding protein [Candidatus Woesearchaeota archaeon]